MISIIIPTYNESKNITLVIKRIHKALEGQQYEAIIIDDNSPDKTWKIAKKLPSKYKVVVIKRSGKLGLSSAVLRGFKRAKGSIIGVIDADLSHPPEKIPELVKYLNSGYDIAVSSRLIKGGMIEDWPFNRRIISKVATLLASPLTNVKDPLSGFFFLKKEVIENCKIIPRGYKILLEILVKGKYKKVKEIPFLFKNRFVGETKLDMKTCLEYILQILSLYFYKITCLVK
jgi:dolichol-phosphate mannosyltransferase